MAFDAVLMGAALEELRALGEVRVEKIHQPARDTLLLLLKGRTRRAKLLIAASPAAPRLHLTETSPENPPEPPMFCMLLRKHLSGARLTAVLQAPMERCAELRFDCIDELGDRVEKKLVVELMGRTCNIYLLSPEGRILDCLRRVGLDDSAKRQALPGLYYQPPEPMAKKDPAQMEAEDFVNLLSAPGPVRLDQRLMDALGGLSPLVCREAALFAAGDLEARRPYPASTGEKLFLFFREHLTHPKPCFRREPNGTLRQFAFCPLRQYGAWEEADSFGGLLDRVYALKGRQDALRQKDQGLRKTVKNLLSRLDRKLAIQEKELAATRDRERLRQFGDIVTANLHCIRKGQTLLEAQDFYDEDMKTVAIPLSPTLSPQGNAAKFYKDYGRMKTAERELTHQLALGAQEREYLHSVLEELDRAQTEQDLEEIRQELQAGGYVSGPTGKKRVKTAGGKPMRFVSTDGIPIFVGRNNRENEELTFRMARKDDLWLHAQKVPGSHVIIACAGAPVPDDTVTQAAQLAAHYSGAAGGRNLPVDVTPVKQVKKLPGGKPGMVIYHTYRTVFVNPYPEITLDPLNAEAPL